MKRVVPVGVIRDVAGANLEERRSLRRGQAKAAPCVKDGSPFGKPFGHALDVTSLDDAIRRLVDPHHELISLDGVLQASSFLPRCLTLANTSYAAFILIPHPACQPM